MLHEIVKYRTVKLLLALVLIVMSDVSFSQEFRCNISVNSAQIQGTNKKVFQTLQTALNEFVNNKPWTKDKFNTGERIECSMMINIQEQLSADEFRATIQVQSRRPVFNSSYNTIMLNCLDNNFSFRYVEFETLEFVENQHKSNLTSVIVFYLYVILGLDYDSFSLEGGTEYYTLAEKIVTAAQGSPDKGWKPFEAKNNKNRYWLIKNLLDKRYENLREFLYRYHRLGLDLFDSKPIEARNQVADNLLLLQKIYRDKPDPFLYVYHLICDNKADEFVNIFSDAMPDEKNRAFQILNEIDNGNARKYEKLKQTN